MWYYLVKLTVSALIIVAVTEIAKRSSGFAALVAALPLTSLLAFVWLHVEGSPNGQIAALSKDIFWLVIPSLLLFLVFPWLLKAGLSFWPSLGWACAATVLAYFLLFWLLRYFHLLS